MSPLLTVTELNEINELMAEVAGLESQAVRKAQELGITDPVDQVGAQIHSALNVVHDIVCKSQDEGVRDDVILKAACLLFQVARLVKRHGIRMNGPAH